MLANIKGLILDMDGVLWRDTTSIGNLPQIFSHIDRLGLKVIYATNNSTKDVVQYIEKLNYFGISSTQDQIVNSSMAATRLLLKKFPSGGNVYAIGEKGLFNTLNEAGFYHSEEKVLAVVVGMDRQVTYEKMAKATLLIRSGIPFLGTNPDRSFPTPEGLHPGTGAIIAAIEAASDVNPIIAGKPFPYMMRIANERLGLKPEEVLVVGDRLETDILGGQNAGYPTALVLSGVSTNEQAQKWEPTPNYVIEDLATLITMIGDKKKSNG